MRENARAFLIALLLALAIRQLVVQAYKFPPISVRLLKDIRRGDHVLCLKTEYLFGRPTRGDLVMFRSAANEDLVSRVIGLPGETVRLANGMVTIDDRDLLEMYVLLPAPYDYSVRVPSDDVFVLPDLRTASAGSPLWGTISRQDIYGRAWLRYWPIARIGLVERPLYAD